MTHSRILRSVMSVVLVAVCATAMAVPAKRVTKTVTMTDGTQLTVTLQGDENLHFYRTADGRIVEPTADGTFTYVSAEKMAKRRANAAKRHASMEQSRRKIRRAPMEPATDGQFIGTKRVLIILAEFQDVHMQSTTATIFNNMANKEGYNDNGHIGSIHDYFYAQSYGKFNLNFDVVGPVRVSNNMAYYGGNNSDGDDEHPAEMVKEAVQKVINMGTYNFANYDWDGDNYVDQVYVVYAGHGEAQGASDDTIWPHQWSLSGAGLSTITANGKKIDTYACSSELKGASGSQMDGIGTLCHEFSHCLGLPDFYDIYYGETNGGVEYQDMSYWSIMAAGSYNSDSAIPAAYTTYERMYCGWLTPTVLNEGANISNMPAITTNSESAGGYIIYNKANNNEFYTLQNIQQTSWNTGAYGHGLLVCHIDYNADIWSDNEVNTKGYYSNNNHPRCIVVCADNNASETSSSLAGDPFPGTKNKTSLTNTTTPAATLYNNNSDGKKYLNTPIENITESSGLISFTFNGGEQAPSPELAWSKTYLSVDIDEGGTPSYPTLTNTHGVSVTYSSSNTSVATISNTGVVTLTGTTGTTTISAIFAGNDDYQAQTVTYTISVYSSTSGNTPAGTLWEEDFGTKYSSNTETYQYNLTDGSLQTQNSSNTNILAGGESPELLIKANNTFSAVIPMNDHYGEMTLTFKSNHVEYLTITANGATIGEITGSNPYYCSVTVPQGTQNVTLNFNNKNSSKNARFDDARLYQGEDTPTPQDPELSWSAAASSARINATDNLFPTLTNPHNVSVSYTSSNTAAATINASTGAISLVAPGTTTISAKFNGNDDYLAQTVTYALTVEAAPVDISNDIENPYTIAEAYDLITAGEDLGTPVFVKGVITHISEVDAIGTYGNATYDISDNTTTAELHIFRGYGLDNVKFNKGAELIQIGDTVIVYGCLQNYNGTYEMSSGNYIVRLAHPTLTFTDGTAYSSNTAKTYYELTYTRNFTKTSWQALYLPFSLSYDDWKDELEIAEIYNIIQYDDDDNGSFDRTYLVVLHKTSGQTLPNRPYLVRAKSAGTFTRTLYNKELQPAESKSIDCSSTFYTYTFTGIYAQRDASVMIANGDYALGGGELHPAASDANLKAQRWYVHITPREDAPTLLPQSIKIIEHGEETEGIEGTTSPNGESSAWGYDLQGRKVSSLKGEQREGLYIVGGKKVIS